MKQLFNNRGTVRCITALFVVTIIMATSFVPTAIAGTATGTQGTPYLGFSCTVTTYQEAARFIVPFNDTQAMHRKGIQTTIGASRTLSRSSTASASITATVGTEFAGLSASVAANVGVSSTVTVSIGTSVSYTISSSTESGLYRIIAAFPQYRTRFRIDRYSMTYSYNVIDETITRVPSFWNSYYDIQRYADAPNN